MSNFTDNTLKNSQSFHRNLLEALESDGDEAAKVVASHEILPENCGKAVAAKQGQNRTHVDERQWRTESVFQCLGVAEIWK